MLSFSPSWYVTVQCTCGDWNILNQLNSFCGNITISNGDPNKFSQPQLLIFSFTPSFLCSMVSSTEFEEEIFDKFEILSDLLNVKHIFTNKLSVVLSTWYPDMSDETNQTLLANVRSARRKWRVAGGWWKRQLSSTTCLISVKSILGQRHTLSLELKRQRFVLDWHISKNKNKIFYVRVWFRKTLPHMIRQLRKLNFNLQNTWKWYKAVLSSPIWRIKYLRSSKYDLFKH